jgi:error-prone DNA polymerase
VGGHGDQLARSLHPHENQHNAQPGPPLARYRERGPGGEGQPPTTAHRIVAERERGGPYRSLYEYVQRTGVRREAAEALILAGALDGLGLGRRELLWQLGLFYRPPSAQLALPLPLDAEMVRLPEPDAWERMAMAYGTLGLSTEHHPMQLLRPRLHEGIASSAHLERLPDGSDVHLAGLVVCRQRPGTAKGILFLSLEDEYGLANAIIKPWLYEHTRLTLRAEPFLLVSGRLQRRDGTTNVIARRVEPLAVPPALAAPRSHDWG